MTDRASHRVLVGLTVIALVAASAAMLSGCGEASPPKAKKAAAVASPKGVFDPAGGWSPAEILDVAVITAVQISPDGSEVVYQVARFLPSSGDQAMHTEMVVTDAKGGGRRVVGSGLKAAGSPRWSPDGKTLAFTALTGGDAETGEGAAPQVFRCDPKGESVAQLTSVGGGVMAFDFSPSGGWIAFTALDAQKPKPGPGGAKDDSVVEGADPTRVNLWRVKAEPGAKPAQLTDGALQVQGWDWSPDEKSIAFLHSTAAAKITWPSGISVLDVASGKVTPLTETKAAHSEPHYSPDGKTIAYTASEVPPADFAAWRVMVAPAPGEGAGEPRALAPTANEMPHLVGWSSDGKTILYHEAVRTGNVVAALPVSGGPPKTLTASDDVADPVTLSGDGTTLAFAIQTLTKPHEVYVATATIDATVTPVQISHENDSLAKMPAPRTEVITWRSTDGMRIEGILTYPLDYEQGKRYPLLLDVHGGPAERFSQTHFAFPSAYPVAALSSKGYGVLCCNPRGSNGYGADFRKANIRDWAGKPYDDLMTGVDEAIKMGVADADRLFVAGWSYGGYMTANITTRTDRFKAAIDGAGPVDLASQDGAGDMPDLGSDYMRAEPWQDPDIYQRESPVFHAGKVKTPTLILHGQSDDRVPYSQAREWDSALDSRGVEHEFVGFPRSGHVILEPQLLLGLYERVIDWIEKHDPGTGKAP